jgi:hypothetical protein
LPRNESLVLNRLGVELLGGKLATGTAPERERELATAGKGWALASLGLGLMAAAGPWLHGTLARVLPFYKNPVDLTWAGFASWVTFSAAALAGFLCGLMTHRKTQRRGRWAGVAWIGGGVSAVAVIYYAFSWLGLAFVDALPWIEHPGF